MRPLPFTILACLALMLQVSLAPTLAVTSARAQPQFLLILAMFVALFARADAALLACWTLGLLLDLATVGPLGAFAFAFGLVGLGILRIRASLFRDHPVSHIFIALTFGFLANFIVAARVAVDRGLSAQLLLIQPLGTAVYTAVLAAFLMPLLNTMRRIMHFPEKGQ